MFAVESNSPMMEYFVSTSEFWSRLDFLVAEIKRAQRIGTQRFNTIPIQWRRSPWRTNPLFILQTTTRTKSSRGKGLLELNDPRWWMPRSACGYPFAIRLSKVASALADYHRGWSMTTTTTVNPEIENRLGFKVIWTCFCPRNRETRLIKVIAHLLIRQIPQL